MSEQSKRKKKKKKKEKKKKKKNRKKTEQGKKNFKQLKFNTLFCIFVHAKNKEKDWVWVRWVVGDY